MNFNKINHGLALSLSLSSIGIFYPTFALAEDIQLQSSFTQAGYRTDPFNRTGYIRLKHGLHQNVHYQYAAIKPDTNHPIKKVNSGCIKNHETGWCEFSLNSKDTVISVQTNGKGDNSVGFRLALNGRNRPTSTEHFQLKSEGHSGVLAGYVYGWKESLSVDEISEAGYTHVIIAFLLFDTSAPGQLNTQAISFDLKSFVDSLKEKGISVGLSIGGASTSIPQTTVSFSEAVRLAQSPQSFIDTMVNSLDEIQKTYGIDFFDIDIEDGLNASASFSDPNQGCSDLSTYVNQCDISYLAHIMTTYHTQSPSVNFTLAPQLANAAPTASFSSVWANYAALFGMSEIAPLLSWVGTQNYNSGCVYSLELDCYPVSSSSTDSAVSVIAGILNDWPATTSTGIVTNFLPYTAHLTDEQVVIGYVAPNQSGVADGEPPADPEVVNQTIQCLRDQSQCSSYKAPAKYPNFKGVFNWSINYDAENDYHFAKTVSPCIQHGTCDASNTGKR